MKKLNSWFEIDEHEYLMYLLKGYDIKVRSNVVIWKLNGKFHREDGPAVIWENGLREWWLYDIPYSKDSYDETIKQLTVDPNTI